MPSSRSRCSASVIAVPGSSSAGSAGTGAGGTGSTHPFSERLGSGYGAWQGLVNAFADAVQAKFAMNVVRALGGVLYLAGGIIMAWNLWATVARQPRIAPARVAVPAE